MKISSEMETVPGVLNKLSPDEWTDLRSGGILLIANISNPFHLVIDKEMGPVTELASGEILVDLYQPENPVKHEYKLEGEF